MRGGRPSLAAPRRSSFSAQSLSTRLSRKWHPVNSQRLGRDLRALDERLALYLARLAGLGDGEGVVDDVLVNIRPGARGAGDNRLYKLRHLGHDVDAVDAAAERGGELGRRVRGGVGPLEGGGRGLGPAGLGVFDNVAAEGGAARAGGEEGAVGGEAGDVDRRGAIGVRGGEFHHDGRVGGRLEICEIPARGCGKWGW